MTAAFAVLAAGGTVVTANNRLARSITLAWNRSQRDAGRRAWRSPAVFSWGAWLEALWARSLVRGGQAAGHQWLGDPQARLLWRRVVADGGETLPGAAAALADVAGAAWRLAQDWHIGVGELAARADSDDTRAFAAWAAEYRRLCTASAWADPGRAASLLCADVQARLVDPPPRLHLAGFIERTPLQARLLDAVAARGCVISEDSAQPRAALQIAHRRCRDAGEELELAARWARQLRGAHADAAVAIVVPDLDRRSSEVRRRVLDILAPDWRLAPGEEQPVNFSCAEPLASVGLVRAALAALRAAEQRLDFRLAGELLATRYLPGQADEASARARVDLALRERIGTTVGLGDLARLAAEHAPALAARLGALAALAARWPRRQSAAAWAAGFREVLECLGWPGDAPLASDEYQAATAWQGVLDDMRRCEALAGALDLPAALDLVEGLARSQAFQPEGDPAAIQVLGVLEAVGQRFDALWVCGMTAAAWPPPARCHPLLPLGLQRERHLPESSPALARERAERRLRWLETAAPAVIFSSPAFEGEEPLAPSPLLAHVPAAPDGLPCWAGLRWTDQLLGAVALEAVVPDPPPPVPAGVRLRGGARLLEHEARCPARAFVEFRLGASELAAPVPGLDAATRGALTHRALETFFRGVASHEDLVGLEPAEEARLLAAAIDAALASCLPLGDPLVRRIAANERERQARLLGEFLRLERQRPRFRVLHTEAWLEGARLPASLAALQLRLRADRIDELGDGRRLVIDYKTGARLPGPKELWGPRPRAPQLPLYATVADADGVAFAQLATGSVLWQGVACDAWGVPGIVTADELTRAEAAGWGELRASWWTALERLAAEILRGCFDIDRWRRDEAQGEWAMAIRPHDLGDPGEPEP